MLFCYITVIQNVEEDVKNAKATLSALIKDAEEIDNNNIPTATPASGTSRVCWLKQRLP